MPEFKCQFCDKLCKNPHTRSIHEVSCKKKTKPTPPQDIKPIPPPPSSEETTAKLSKLDGELRQLPFYSEISDKMGKVDERMGGLEQIILAISDNLKNITPQIAKIDSFIQGQGTPSQPQEKEATPQSTLERLEKVSAQTQPQPAPGDKLGAYIDKGIELLKIGAGSGNPSGGVEGKYNELIGLANVLKAIQGDPYEHITKDLNLFVNIAKVFSGKSIPSLPEEKPKLEEHLRE